jgi:flagellar basal-body rod protein FlgB
MVDATTSMLEKALDLRMQAHSLHTSNLANANVPDFKSKKIDFEDRMRKALEPLSETGGTLRLREELAQMRLQNLSADIVADPLARMKGDGNTVDADHEQTELAKNTIGYEGAIRLINKKLAMQKYVLSGDGGR